MAGNGPAPAETRRRRNVPARGEWIDLKPLKKTYLPDLPPVTDGDGEPWRGATKLTWSAWQGDPVTQMWSEADIAYALDTILLHNEMTSRTANEVRLRMDGLGVTPKGKRDHRWRIVEADDDVDQPAEPKKRGRAKRSADRQARLSGPDLSLVK